MFTLVEPVSYKKRSDSLFKPPLSVQHKATFKHTIHIHPQVNVERTINLNLHVFRLEEMVKKLQYL